MSSPIDFTEGTDKTTIQPEGFGRLHIVGVEFHRI